MIHIKVCGITNLEDALIAADAGADMLGYIFYARSPRYIEPERAGEIIATLDAQGCAPKFVGVFVNESVEQVRKVMQIAHLDLVQLHGNEPAELVQALAPFAFKALRPRSVSQAMEVIEPYRTVVAHSTPAFIVDAYDAKQFGGTGTRADWTSASLIAREFPILLAGGLNPENVAEVIEAVNPWGVDVSSGVERAPGLKDHAKIHQFIQASKIHNLFDQ
jgi:phosphoribosylanthranilate isomerase